MDYQAITDSYLSKFNIRYCPKEVCKCWERPHAHPSERLICKIPLPKTRFSLFEFLHEVGHIVHPKGGILDDVQVIEEYYATLYAKQEMRKLGIPVPRRMHREYNRYIADCLSNDLKSGLSKCPPEVRHLRPRPFIDLKKIVQTMKKLYNYKRVLNIWASKYR